MEKKISIKTVWDIILEKKFFLIWGQILILVSILISVPIPLMLPVLVDEILLDKPALFVETINNWLGSGTAFYYIALVGLTVIFLRCIHFLFTALIIKIFTNIAKYVTFHIRKKCITHLQKVCMNAYESLGSGAITSNLVTDVNTLDNFIITGASRFVSSVVIIIVVAVIIIMIHPILGSMILFIQPLVMLLSKKISKSVGYLKSDENMAIEKFQNSFGETLDLFGQIKASNKEKQFFDEAILKAKAIQDKSNAYSYKSVAYEKFSFTLFLIAFEVLRASGLIMVAYSDLSIGMMFAMFGYIWFIMTPVQEIISVQYSYANAKAAIQRINRIFDLKMEKSGNEKIVYNGFGIDIRIENLSFSYKKNKPLLQKISLNIKAKEKIALIGASGSGKTTLAQLISGFYMKDSGEIYYNNRSIDNIDKKSLRDSIFLVLQMPILFNNTLRFNITMGNDAIADEEILKALEIAQLKDMTLYMNEGLDTIVGKQGIRLSGGQRQRLSIARMVIADPLVVIFDESTSALDVNTEIKLFNALIPILKNKTVITIAHRLSTVKNANKIFVLNEGQLVQKGTHKELKLEEGHYQEFLKNQLNLC